MTVSGVSGSGAASANSASRTTIAGNFDTFLQLLTTQLKNQNPLDPLDTNQFTQQLVQFSSVEQQLQTNDYLSALVQANSGGGNASAVNYIGKIVTASGVKSDLVKGGKATWNFTIPNDANVTLTIKDANGNVVYGQTGALKAGAGQFQWDGTTTDGATAPPGTYSISMTGTDNNGKLVSISTRTTGVVTGVDFTGSEPVLLVGNSRLNLSGVTSVLDPAAYTTTPDDTSDEAPDDTPDAT